MRIRPQRTVATALLGLAMMLAACGGSAAETSSSTSSAEADQPVALLSGDFTTISGTELDLRSLEGQDVVLWFWAPW